MLDDLQKQIINKLSDYGQQGCSVNELFRNLKCSKNDFVKSKDQLIKQGVISAAKEGKQRIRLFTNPSYFSGLDKSFHYKIKQYETTADDALKQLRKLKPLFVHTQDNQPLITHRNVSGLIQTITGALEGISHYTMIYTLRYHIDPHAKKSDLRENQRLGLEVIQKIIEKLIEQHKDEEQDLRNYLLWGTSSAFSYVF
ncbi:MAG: hypothetical protein QXN55_02070 [Candidatus Nitrosotenuis sp.]